MMVRYDGSTHSARNRYGNDLFVALIAVRGVRSASGEGDGSVDERILRQQKATQLAKLFLQHAWVDLQRGVSLVR